jgi:YrbI family 3-deoxy-D-manno-octulosonate 8-phosphate phosphatase
MTTADLRAKAATIELLLLDVDGVLTDGKLVYTDDGAQAKAFHVRDGAGIKFWQGTGKRVAIISGRDSRGVDVRAKELGITPCLQNRKDKRPAFCEVLAACNVSPTQVACMGDDLPDLPLMLQAGVSIAPADACAEVRAIATHVTAAKGGEGAVREAIEWLMTHAGTWPAVVVRFQARHEVTT